MDFVFLSDDEHTYVRRKAGKGRVRMLAHPSQVALMTQAKTSVDVVGTNKLDGRRKLTPDYVLDVLEQCDDVRRLKTEEFSALEYASCFRKAFPDTRVTLPMPNAVAQSFTVHPLLKAGIGFATDGAYPLGLMYLLNDVYDIRRFEHPKRPHKVGRLRSHLCLVSPRRVIDLYNGLNPEPGSPAYRTSVAIGGWFLVPIDMLDREHIARSPTHFFYRRFLEEFKETAKHAGNALEATAVATWKTTLKYASFLYQLWLSAVSEYEFDAERFFEDDDIASAFTRYIEQLDEDLDISVPGANVK